MKKAIILIVYVCVANLCLAQKYDYQWPFGYGSSFDLSFGISLIDFNEELVSISPYAETEPFELGNAGSFICDSDGQLMLMTNNCTIVDANFQIIEGGTDLTPGYGNDFYCPDGNYPAYHSTLFLPDLIRDSVTYLLHKDIEASDSLQDVASFNLYLSTIVKRTDGSFYVKEQRNILDTLTMFGRLVGGVHASGDRWWITVMGYNSNRFYTFQVGGVDTLSGPIIQEVGLEVTNSEISIGQPSYSPDMTMLAINSVAYGILLYDFDDVTGTISNPRQIPYPHMNQARGLCFSPNSRFVYVTTAEYIYQIDLDAPDPAAAVTELGHIWEPAENGWPIGAGYMYLGPDCRIYISPATTIWYLHVIHQPDQPGIAADLNLRAIRTPTRIEFDFPHLPMYRFNGQCDSTIVWDFPTAVEEVDGVAESLRLYPNPAQAVLHVRGLTRHTEGAIYSALGQRLRMVIASEAIDITDLSPGYYRLWIAGYGSYAFVKK